MGVLYEAMENKDGAISEFQKAFELNPKDQDAILRVASLNVLKAQARTSNALTYYKNAVEGYQKYLVLDPGNDKIWQSCGSVQIQIGSTLENQAATREELKKPNAAEKKEIQTLRDEAKSYLDAGMASMKKAEDLKAQK